MLMQTSVALAGIDQREALWFVGLRQGRELGGEHRAS
jgi:hypothetical protein